MSRRVKTFIRRSPSYRRLQVPVYRRTIGLPDDDLHVLQSYQKRKEVFDDYDRYYLCKRWLRTGGDDDQEMDELSRAWLLLHRFARITRNVNYARACPFDPEVADILENSRRLLIRNNIGLPL